MLTNYIKIAWRNLIKGRLFSFINLFGLGLGAAIALLILAYVQHEWSYDGFHENSDRIYRAWVKEHYKGDIFFNTITPYLLGAEIKDNFTDVKDVARYLTTNSLVKEGSEVQEETVHLAEPSFLTMFDFPIIEGTESPLEDLLSAAITQRVATKYFGTESPIGNTLTLQIGGEWITYTVHAMLKDPPGNSSLQFDIIIPFENTLKFMSEGGRNCWTCVMVETYVLLNEANDADGLRKQFAPFVDEKVSRIYEPGQYVIGFQPLKDIHLNNDYPVGIAPVSDAKYPYILSAIALLILILACINFTTLAIGRSISRAKEVGVRKVTGASRNQLLLQFWSEAFLTVFISIVLAVVLAKFLLPYFNVLSDKQLSIQPDIMLILNILGLSLVVGTFAGVYPALAISRFKPIQALHGSISKLGKDKHIILRSLVGFQFGLSIILIISSLIMQNQMKYLQNKNLGYEKEYVVSFPYQVSGQGLLKMWEDGELVFERLKSKLAGLDGISGLSLSSHALGTLGWSRLGYTDQETNKFMKFITQKIDENYLDMMGIGLVDGRNFTENMGMDKRSVIINQAMVREFNLDPAVGSTLPGPFREYRIIGVTEDFHHSSLHNPVTPLVMAMDGVGMINSAPDHTYIDPPVPKISIKVGSDNLQNTLNRIKLAWLEVAPEQPFNYSFIDDNLDQQYRKESKLSQIMSFSTLIAIIIACLGLFGISALTIASRTKEIGVRRVLGASSLGIVRLISYDFLKLVFIAIIVASPIAWWAMNEWLNDFTFNAGINWYLFPISYAAAILLALATISIQSIRAALTNPVNTLRNE